LVPTFSSRTLRHAPVLPQAAGVLYAPKEIAMNSFRIPGLAFFFALFIVPVRYFLANRLIGVQEILDSLAYAFGERE
jgi:hypothetical protein